MRVHRAQSLAGLSLRDIEYAVAVADLRHFGKAADRCAVSQSALSEQVRKLEARLGIALFERSHRGVAPTPRGAALLQQAGRVLAEARGLLEMAASLAEPATGPLYLGVIATLGPYYMPHLLRPVRLQFPNLALRVTEGRTVELLEELRRGVLDAVSGTVREVGGPPSHLLAALARADCFFVVPEEVTELAAGSPVEVWLLDG